MKILVFSYRLVVSGTVINAIELAAALRDLHGFEVAFFAAPGPMLSMVEAKGLHYIPSPDTTFYPAPSRMRALRQAVRRENPDLIYVWDWQQCMDAYYGVHLPMRIPMLVTDMSMHVPRLLPKTLPTTFGTPELVDQAKAKGRTSAELLVPPVDLSLNNPEAVDGRAFRKQYQIADTDTVLVTVSRLDRHMKGESLFRTVEMVRALGRDLPLQLVIAGDGTARAELEQKAAAINSELGRRAILLTGALLDPRPAYAAADIVAGMGGSALRGMAFGKPVVVMGEEGFASLFTPANAQSFYYKGMYGRGATAGGEAQLMSEIRQLVEDPERRASLGEFSRRFVTQKFSLETVSSALAEMCRTTVFTPRPRYAAAADALRTAAVYVRERRFLTPLSVAARKKA